MAISLGEVSPAMAAYYYILTSLGNIPAASLGQQT